MFKKFQSLTNTKLKYLAYWQETHGDEQVVVTEKIHGANYQVSYDSTGFTVGSRTKQLGATEGLYSDLTIRSIFCDRVKLMYTLMKEQLVAQEVAACSIRDSLLAKKLYKEAHDSYAQLTPSISPNFRSLRVRGELYGGYYDHEDVVSFPIKRVGKGGISYAQNASVSVFRVEVDDVPLSFEEAKLLCFSVDLPTVPVVFLGTLDEAVEWSAQHVSDNTLIPNGTPWLQEDGTPLLLDGAPQPLPYIKGNGREGHVISFRKPVFMADGREVIFKDINPSHSESKKIKKAKPVINFTTEEAYVLNSVSLGFTEERMITQFSYDSYTVRDFRSVMGKVVSDCIGEAKEADAYLEDLYEGFTTAQRNKVNNELTRSCIETLGSYFKELCRA